MKYYSLRFGSGDSRNSSGLAPTMVLFFRMTDGLALSAPGITEILASSGIYTFQYGTTQPIAFLCDGATTGLASSVRYVAGQLDPADRSDEYGTTLTAIGTTNVALGTTSVALGTTAVALGTTAVALGITNVAFGTTNFALNSTQIALGTTAIAFGVTILSVVNAGASSPLALSIGSTASSFGTSSADPVDLFGYLRRVLENLEGNSTFTKSSGVLQIQARNTTLLATKTITNSVSTVIKT